MSNIYKNVSSANPHGIDDDFFEDKTNYLPDTVEDQLKKYKEEADYWDR